ncbi:hypothetical protein LX15_002662 [Streptoalloteichus tenebrarius]|uniref:SpaA-like prealbumin fold domain-containing protein n=1 Tax=Streptoalloteichus tenebrarius (strain ATCC 17920 / DSM 40477 / JCM 4838 / CBS 697.72 / NBRC 16177 / NCIMB 11028 / NRRL B-12390 / A12253. 1 / ISP 5477) TaxID=1933 RepID=A0ABT1HTV4_STRSD|nr:hypothetical protein [Streptoalloteichus tenebrarius]MCP2258963.1 hypothetical protein [Streptoalloteichus tenebrarius]BFF01172.1 hypothetical protein GCM10020241_28470 [Streptoalloteichus tenebrarius]
MQGLRKLLTWLAGSTLLAAAATVAVPGSATAAGERLGHNVKAQPYKGQRHDTDWLGSYTWRGQQVWCVQFALNEPSDDVDFQPGGPLTTKWGEPLSAEVAAKVSYLLLRYQNTTSADEAAALAHLLHSWTAGTTDQGRLDPNNGYETIGYNVQYHLDELAKTKPKAKEAVARLEADAEAHRGPWKLTLTPPKQAQTVGKADKWTVQVVSATGKPVGGVPVQLTVTGGTLGGDAAGGTAKTPANGAPLAVDLTPTGLNPKLAASVRAPSAQPVLLKPNKPGVQQVITTGGETPLSQEGTVTARNAPGEVKVSKVDASTGAAISGVALRVTAADKTSPALRQDDGKLTGSDGKPLVVRTGKDGTAAVPDLKTPQEVCLVEVEAAPGYDKGFDAKNPPTACGTLTPGSTLALTLVNKPNPAPKPVVPITIPAGSEQAAGVAPTRTVLTPAGVFGLGALTLLGAGLGGALCWRRLAVRRAGRR